MNKLGSVSVRKDLLFLIVCMIALLGFVAGTRVDELSAAVSRVVGIPRSQEKIDLSSVQTTYQYLRENYDGKLDTGKLIEGANKGLVEAAGDRHTVYLPKVDAKALQDDLDGDIGGGIGAEIGMRNGQATVVRTLPGNPAERAGIKKGDQIMFVNDEDVRGKDVDVVVAKIRGKEGTTVELTMKRDGEEEKFTITRAIINNPSVQSSVESGVGILTISRFDGETGALSRKAAEEFVRQDVKGVILDMRGDGGGYMDGAIDVASLWVDRDVVVTQKKRQKVIDEARASGDALLANIKTVILVDEGTASASEIVAGALRDYGKAQLVGKKTYGKGSVQQLINLSDGAQLKVTVAKWYTPKGNNIDGKGLTPDLVIELTREDIDNDRDPQLDAALKEVK